MSEAVSLEYDALARAYVDNLHTALRHFSQGPEFLDGWAHDEDHGRSLLNMFEAAREAAYKVKASYAAETPSASFDSPGVSAEDITKVSERHKHMPQAGDVDSWGGVLSTAGGVVFFGEDSGALMAADAGNGKSLWSFQTNALWKASPMTYVFDHRQYVAVAAGPSIMAFAVR